MTFDVETIKAVFDVGAGVIALACYKQLGAIVTRHEERITRLERHLPRRKVVGDGGRRGARKDRRK